MKALHCRSMRDGNIQTQVPSLQPKAKTEVRGQGACMRPSDKKTARDLLSQGLVEEL